MQRLTLKQVVTKCLLSLRNHEGRLGHSAQFIDGEHCCAIGIALNAKSKRVISHSDQDLNITGLLTLRQQGVITTQAEESSDLNFIQRVHDLWAYGDECLYGCWFHPTDQGVRASFYLRNKGQRMTEDKFKELLEDFECLT